jgi:hypothetical protein
MEGMQISPHTMLDTQECDATTDVKNGSGTSLPDAAVSWSASPTGKVDIVPSVDSKSAVIKAILGQTGNVTVTATAGTASDSGVIGIQSSAPTSVGMAFGVVNRPRS